MGGADGCCRPSPAPARTRIRLVSDIDSYRGTLARRLIVGFRAVDEQRREQSAELLSALDSAHVRFAVLKGNAVAEICYFATWLREFNDLDVLVDGPDLERAATALRQLG